jgi:hypothetical protein
LDAIVNCIVGLENDCEVFALLMANTIKDGEDIRGQEIFTNPITVEWRG